MNFDWKIKLTRDMDKLFWTYMLVWIGALIFCGDMGYEKLGNRVSLVALTGIFTFGIFLTFKTAWMLHRMSPEAEALLREQDARRAVQNIIRDRERHRTDKAIQNLKATLENLSPEVEKTEIDLHQSTFINAIDGLDV